MVSSPSPESRFGQEALLLDYVKGLRRHRQDRLAIRFALSDLERRHREPSYLRQAAREIRPLVTRYEGRLFRLANDDIVVVVKGAARGDIDTHILRVRMIFRDDAHLQAGDAVDQDILTTVYNLETGFDAFRAEMEALVQRVEAEVPDPAPAPRAQAAGPADHDDHADRAEADPEPAPDEMPVGTPTVRVVHDRGRSQTPLDPLAFNRLSSALTRLDASVFATARPVLMLARGTPPKRVLTYHTFSLERAEARLMPEYRLDADAAYARKLHQIMNRQVIDGGVRLPADDGTPLMVDFETDSALDPDLLERFVRTLGNRPLGKVILGFRAEDVLSQPDRYLAARRAIRRRGLRTAIAGADILTFGAMFWELLSSEFYAVPYRADSAEALSDSAAKQVAETVRRVGPARVMLFGCNRASAVEKGRALGFRLFEGAVASAALAGGGDAGP